MARFIYLLALWVALPWVVARLWWRGRSEPAYRQAIAERFGRYRSRAAGSSRAASSRPVIWLHAVSMGETRAAQPLVALLRIRYPHHELLITHMTATGRETALELYGGDATLAWLPYDYPFAVRAFLDHYKPQIGILMETEIWFNLVGECARRRLPLLLASARMSEHSLRGYRVAGVLARDAFSALAIAGAQTQADADRLLALGARNVVVTGNLKFDVVPGETAAELARLMRSRTGGRQVFLVASTRDGEEELILDALNESLPEGALIVIVPRHPQRFAEVARLLEARGIEYVRRTDECDIPASTRVLLGDSLGEMPAYYAAADIAFVGGSLLPYGGQNLIEACAAGVAVLVGPHTFNFAQAANEAVAAGAAERVPDASALIQLVRRLLADSVMRSAMGRAGKVFCARHRGAAVRTAALVEDLLGAQGH